jgi:hypothetical protein
MLEGMHVNNSKSTSLIYYTTSLFHHTLFFLLFSTLQTSAETRAELAEKRMGGCLIELIKLVKDAYIKGGEVRTC